MVRTGHGSRDAAAELAVRVESSLTALVGGSLTEGGPLVVAASGGLDSCVLAHLLRFRAAARPELVMAHFDHAMRPESRADADWLRGVGRAWDVPVREARAARAPASEDEARDARYAFLESVRAEVGARWVLTAHHADDQAETVLFRILRGTGIDGLRGMDPRREPGIVRPLLSVWREELEAYAATVGLRWREDPTNRLSSYARNTIRNELLPTAEAGVAPGARRALVRLAGLARQDEAAWEEVMPGVLEALGASRDGVDAVGAAGLGPALRGRVIRHLAAGAGLVLDAAATDRAVAFAADAASGHGIPLGRGFDLRRELDRLVVVKAPGEGEESDLELEIPDSGPGGGTAHLGGRDVRVRWRPGANGSGVRVVLPLDAVAFPLVVRARRPGDRIDVWGGPRRVKRLLQDARVPSLQRGGVPVVADANGRVLWVAGVAECAEAGVEAEESEVLTITLEEDA